ncbi:MAG: MarR family transcriptional regulator [Patescibacteria group bacterium]|nr:MarR family transcriptional regulator [Patescibacteria group bacterium]
MKQENTMGEIIHFFFGAFRAIKSQMGFASPIFQLPLAQMETLRFIGEKEKVQMKEVADYLAITPPSATVMVNILVDLGYVERQAGRQDRRAVRLSLTKKGRQILEKAVTQRCQRMKKLLSKLNQREQAELLGLLKKMSK